jgi:undecaprenyl-diphosphatase
MSLFQAIVTGVVQGLTEFIPVSSSGHIVLVPTVFGWERTGGLTFDVLLHTASLLALFAYFSGDLLDLGRGIRAGDPGSRKLALVLVVGSIPAGIAGIAFGEFFEGRFADPPAAALTLVVTAAVLIAGERALAVRERKAAETGARLKRVGDFGYPEGIVVGLAQAAAIFPGLSRSGSTIAAGLAMGAPPHDAARSAFLVATPAPAGATRKQPPKRGGM